MVATVTFAAASQPKSVANVSTIDSLQMITTNTYSSGTSATGAVHFKSLLIPTGATILDVGIYCVAENTTAGYGVNVGIAGGITSAALFGSDSFSTTTRYVSMAASPTGAALPYKVSVSDDATVRYVYPTVTTITTGTDSITLSIGVRVTWTMNKGNALP